MLAHSLNFAMLSHPGRHRKGNEDTCAALLEMAAYIVCDGMGGAAAGEVASHLATQAFLQSLGDHTGAAPESRLKAAVDAANQAVYQRSRSAAHLSGMGTTLVALLQLPGTLVLAHVGDSRAYLLRGGHLTRLTHDHSYVEEHLRAGDLTPTQAFHHPWRNIITRAIGSQPVVESDILRLDPHRGDLFLLASDGLTTELSDSTIAEVLGRPQRDLAVLCEMLVDCANQAGGRDNITVLLLQIP